MPTTEEISTNIAEQDDAGGGQGSAAEGGGPAVVGLDVDSAGPRLRGGRGLVHHRRRTALGAFEGAGRGGTGRG